MYMHMLMQFVPTKQGYLRFMEESKIVYDAFEDVVANNPTCRSFMHGICDILVSMYVGLCTHPLTHTYVQMNRCDILDLREGRPSQTISST